MQALRKILHSYVLVALFALSASAWGETGGRYRTYLINLFGGFAFPLTQPDEAGNAATTNGVAFGVGLDYKIQPHVALGGSIIYSVKSLNSRFNGQVNNYQLSYVTLPIELKYVPVPQFNLHAGPYLASLLVSAIQESNGSFLPVKNQFRNDFGVTAGVWFGFMAGYSLTVGMDIRYDHGFANVQADGDANTNVNVRSLQILGSVGFAFD